MLCYVIATTFEMSGSKLISVSVCLMVVLSLVLMVNGAHNLPDEGAADHLPTRSHHVVAPLRTVFNRMDCLTDDAQVSGGLQFHVGPTQIQIHSYLILPYLLLMVVQQISPEEMAVFIDQMDTGRF
jgi:hypothetical protein